MTTEELAEVQAEAHAEYHVTLFLPFYGLPQTREVLFPEEINTTEGIVNLPKVRYD